MTKVTDIPLKSIDGAETRLGDHAGKVLLVVNTASKCGLTPQYEGLEALQRRYGGEGFSVVGVPSNDFAGQEPGSEAEVADFCKTTYDVSFPLTAKTKVVGPDKHALYAALTAAQPSAAGGNAMREKLAGYGMTPNPEPEVLWNFEKFLIGRDGAVIGRFTPDTAPDSPALTAAIEAALKG